MSDQAAFSDDMLVGLTPEQREAVMSLAPRLLVRATAGSGKTHVLTFGSSDASRRGKLTPIKCSP